jgi:two-component system response regulator (stage 0 sporulation protein F)
MDNQIKILVVDDDPEICHLIEQILKREGYQVDVSFSGIEALQMIRSFNYHLLLTDLEMPGVDGLELARKAKKQDPEIRVIMVAGNTAIDTTVQSLRHGVDIYITKPFNIFELKKAVKQTLHTRQVVLENV